MFASRVGVAVALAAVLVTAVAAAQPVVAGRAIWSYVAVDDDSGALRGFRQVYDANYDRTITDPFRLRLSFRGEGSDTTQTLFGADHKSNVWLLQPGGEVDYTLPKFNFQARYDLYDTKSTSDALSGSRRTLRGYESLVWSPDAAPSLTLQAFQNDDRDLLANLDTKEDRFLEDLTYLWRGFTFIQTAHYADFQMPQSAFDRKTLDLQGQVHYDNVRSDGRAAITAYAIAGATRIDETATGANAVVPTQVAISAASYSHDETPLDARDNPPIANFALIDGNFSARTDIGVGPAAPLYQNLVFDMGRVVGLDTFRVFVRDASGNLVPVQGLLRWDVYTSGDALDWTPIRGGAQTSFIFSLSAYEVTFAKTSSRYFKIVSFGTSSQEAFVTELQAFFHTELDRGATRRTDQRFVSASVDATVKPLSWLALRYYGLGNVYDTQQPDRPDYNSRDFDHQVWLYVNQDQPLNGNVRYERRTSTSGENPQDTLDGLWGYVQWVFHRNLQTSLEASRTVEHGSVELTADTIRLHEYMRLYRSIELSVDGGVQHEDFDSIQLQARHVFVNGVAYIQLTKAVRLILSTNWEKVHYTGEGTASLVDLEPVNTRYYGEIWYRPSGQLLLSARLGYVKAPGVDAKTNTYRVEWYPFARGTVGFGTIYDEDVETNGTYRRFRRIQFIPKWQMNRHLSLDVNYTYLTLLDRGIALLPPQSNESKTKQLWFNLTWIL